MKETITANYESDTAVKNVVGALVDSVGIPQENIFVDEPIHQVKVITPAATEGEVRKIMQSEGPKDISERLWEEK